MKKNKKTNTTDKLKSLLEEIKKEYGEGTLMTLGEAPKVDVETLSTGSLALDIALGVGGLPRGRVVEIFGPESSGKTTLALEVIAQAQQQEGKAAFVDAEHALDPEYAKKIGVKIEELIISQPDSGEDALAIVERLLKSGLFDVIAIDSVAALVPRVELEGEIGDQFIGLQARLMSQALRKLTSTISKTKTIVIFLNQTRAKIGMGIIPGMGETTPGGKALKFYSSVRIELKRIAQIKKGDQVIGNKIKARVVKNKVAPPFRSVVFEIYYNEGISLESDILTLGEKYGIIKKSGHSYYYQEEKIGSNFESARNFLKENKKLAQKLIKLIKERVSEEV